jgi:hypothetical protein
MAGLNLLVKEAPLSREKSPCVFVLAFLVGVAMSSAMGITMIQTKASSASILRLPAPEQKGRMSLEEALARLRSVREFPREALTERKLSQLLWAAQGVTHPEGLRTAPSGAAVCQRLTRWASDS